jgi:hypothetical protein
VDKAKLEALHKQLHGVEAQYETIVQVKNALACIAEAVAEKRRFSDVDTLNLTVTQFGARPCSFGLELRSMPPSFSLPLLRSMLEQILHYAEWTIETFEANVPAPKVAPVPAPTPASTPESADRYTAYRATVARLKRHLSVLGDRVLRIPPDAAAAWQEELELIIGRRQQCWRELTTAEQTFLIECGEA